MAMVLLTERPSTSRWRAFSCANSPNTATTPVLYARALDQPATNIAQTRTTPMPMNHNMPHSKSTSSRVDGEIHCVCATSSVTKFIPGQKQISTKERNGRKPVMLLERQGLIADTRKACVQSVKSPAL